MSDPVRLALRMGGIYLALATLWILLSDRAVDAVLADPEARATAQTLKGLLFVTGTSALIFVLIYRYASQREEVEGRYRSVVDQSLVGIYVLRGDRFLFVNTRFAEIVGYTAKELTSSVRVSDLVAPEDRDRVADNIRRREAGVQEELDYTLGLIRKDGEAIRAEVHGRGTLWEGEPAVLGVLMDITEKERLEAQEWRQQRLETLGQLTATVTHDFKNLLTSISTPLELTLDRLEPHHPAREDLVEARENTERAVTLTRQLLAFCRQRSHRPRPVDLGALAAKAEPMLRRLLPEGVHLRLEIQDDLPPAWVDPDRLEQVLLNLTVNAVEAVGEEGAIRVRTLPPQASSGDARDEGTEAPATVVVEVEDDGVGMDEATRRRVFEPFFTTKEEGTGLGLATVHGIVRQAGGSIDVASAPGGGCTFRIELPASAMPAEPLEGGERKPPAPAERAEGSTVLVVDDDQGVRRSTARALERKGFRVLQAGTAHAALTLLEEDGSAVNVVLTDVVLPDLDGTRLASRIGSRRPDLTILFMSGRTEEEVFGGPGDGPRTGFVEKPFSVETLVREVQRGLR